MSNASIKILLAENGGAEICAVRAVAGESPELVVPICVLPVAEDTPPSSEHAVSFREYLGEYWHYFDRLGAVRPNAVYGYSVAVAALEGALFGSAVARAEIDEALDYFEQHEDVACAAACFSDDPQGAIAVVGSLAA